MDYKDIVALYFERSNQMHTLWSLYLAVCLVLPALVGIVRSSARRLFVGAVLYFALAVIAVINLSASIDTTRTRIACRDLLRSGVLEHVPGETVQQQINAMIRPPSVAAVTGVQIDGDLLALVRSGISCSSGARQGNEESWLYCPRCFFRDGRFRGARASWASSASIHLMSWSTGVGRA